MCMAACGKPKAAVNQSDSSISQRDNIINQRDSIITNPEAIISQSDNSITFTVDGELPAPQKEIKSGSGADMEKYIVYSSKTSNKKSPTLASSFRKDKFSPMGTAVFFKALVTAYADHRPIVLSPDMIWLLISQGVSHYINENPEAMRDKLVSHTGKKLLTVLSPCDVYSPKVRWDEIVKDFHAQIAANTKGDFAKTMVADFSTTGIVERTVSEMTLMSAVKSYFDFLVIYIYCGIPYITLEGTSADWESILNRTRALEQYGMGWWTADLIPILNEFVNASKGSINQAFWKSIVKKQRVDEFDGGGCSMEEPTMLDGWFLTLMPFSESGRTPKEVIYSYDKIIPQMVTADFVYQMQDRQGNVIKSVPMEMWAGFVGVDVNPKDGAIRPKMGWLVRERENEKDKLEMLISRAGEEDLIVREIPDVLQKVDYLPALNFEFQDKIILPKWIGNVKIDKMIFKGKFTNAYFDSVKALFPGRTVKNYDNIRIAVTSVKSFAPSDYIYNNITEGINECKFPNGNWGMMKFITENSRLKGRKFKRKNPDDDFDRSTDVKFVVEKDGSISNLKIKSRKGNKAVEAELYRIFKIMPKWKPATRNGKPVRMLQSESIEDIYLYAKEG